jgi:dienelactone hydrolase
MASRAVSMMLMCAVALLWTAAQPATAIDATLAKTCRAMALKAHPTAKVGTKGSNAAQAQRDYFKECVAKGGKMDENPSDKTGQEQK